MPLTDRPRQSGPIPDIARDPDAPHVRHWQALVAAGLIGTPPVADAAVRENVARTEALFRRLRWGGA